MLVELAFASGVSSVRGRLPSVDERLASQPSKMSPLFVLGVACAVCGAGIRLWSYRAMGAHFTFHLSLLKNHKLITTGPYAYVRHPAYTALVLTLTGVYICELSTGSWWTESRAFESMLGKGVALIGGWLAAMCAVICSRVGQEDAMLHRCFEKEWEDWARRVRSRFVPGVL